MAKRRLTKRFVESLRPAPRGKRVEYWDSVVPNFGARVTDRGKVSWGLYLRWPGSRTPTRRRVGNFPAMPIDDARQRAWEWLRLVELGIDPMQQQLAAQKAEQQKERTTFAAVAEDWFRDAIQHQRKAAEVESDVRREFLASLGDKPIADITTLELRDIIKNKALGLSPAPGARKTGPAPAQARNLLGHVKQLFSWAVEQHSYDLEKSPADALRGGRLIGKKVRRRRVLNDEELRAVWEAAEETEYPYGPLFRMLILTGQRKSEVAKAVWSEFDMVRRLWTIPAERMKMEDNDDHEVPITEDLMSLLATLPRYNTGNHLFSTTFGASPVNGFSKAKERINELVVDKIDPKADPKKRWVIHDLRRTMRTHLGALPIPDNVRELMIAHAQPELHKTYDQWKYREEKRAGFGLWHDRLRAILQHPTASNVVPLHR
jgi:integrase